MNIQNDLISDINNFCSVTYFESNQSGFKTQKNHKLIGVGQNIENDAINNNNNDSSIYNNNTIIISS